MSRARDFWLSCGHHLLDREADGGLVVTDEFLKAYLARPEIAPPPEACPAERELHGALLLDPRRPVAPSRIAAIADADARENWELMIAWRDHLAEHATLEASYLDIVRRSLRFPNVFIDQLVHVVLRNMLDGCDDAFVLRAAELFFRPQKLALRGGSLVATDEEAASGFDVRPVPPLVSMLGLPAAGEIDVLGNANAESYWERSDRFDIALDLTAGRRGLAALGDVVTRWISHLLAINVEIEPVIELRDVPLTWYVGLDSEATRIGDALWNGEDPGEVMRPRVVGLYRLNFADPGDVIEKVRGEPIYLLMAMTANDVLRLKPQNLVTGLPIRQRETVP
ncbi:hypothetical protein SAMN05444161_8453 [Rhizobiales bacterium GAS191]|nr:hypothetical protein SAMN05444161_8453 [Rhizobiales bacterium GAS191]